MYFTPLSISGRFAVFLWPFGATSIVRSKVAIASASRAVNPDASGETHRRHAFRSMLAAWERDEVDVVVTFATNRLFRKLYRSLQFVEEGVVDRGKRCMFVAQNIDTAQDFWRQLLSTFATHDEMMVQALAGQVRAAYEGCC